MTAVQSSSLFRRAAVLLLLTAGLVMGAALPSWASFTSSVDLPQTTVSTATLAVPGVPTGRATCTGSTATVTVTWNASTAPRVSGYNRSSCVMCRAGGTATSTPISSAG